MALFETLKSETAGWVLFALGWIGVGFCLAAGVYAFDLLVGWVG